jgi:tetratricopeptide (TPR) repeat protein
VTAFGTYTRNFDWVTEEILWKSAIKAAPENARPYQNLALAYRNSGAYQKALTLLFQALDLKDSKPKFARMISFNNISDIYRRERKTDLAVLYSKKALESIGSDDMLLNYITTLVEADQVPTAGRLIRKLLQSKSGTARELNVNSIILLKLKQYEGAYKNGLKTIRKYPFHPDANLYFGLASMFSGRYVKAAHYLNRALSLGSSLPLQIHLALFENSVRSTDIHKQDLYLAQIMKNFSMARIKQVLYSIKKEQYPVFNLSVDSLVNRFSKRMKSLWSLSRGGKTDDG